MVAMKFDFIRADGIGSAMGTIDSEFSHQQFAILSPFDKKLQKWKTTVIDKSTNQPVALMSATRESTTGSLMYVSLNNDANAKLEPIVRKYALERYGKEVPYEADINIKIADGKSDDKTGVDLLKTDIGIDAISPQEAGKTPRLRSQAHRTRRPPVPPTTAPTR